ncbi:Serine/threonine protein phosphatase PrpC [Parafrankia irregularis]|uniref:Serine/threonine protein phosphatase PrpC n=1 Tax=Parafrankia irregularis TaxID=795642 RepID=A0A0S4QS86_9ACTN|nr:MULTISPECIES: PP2C family serine/threonine-protein phosphatase [Parafrankia]MBE3204612.1 serine/threonine-protein phosphatase [Parafrankia sp. CH37]CUU58465.1 Serine/threonine protein phosphatase PrpC [Parafrankia irregularis]
MDLNSRSGHSYPGHGYPPARPGGHHPGDGYPEEAGHASGYHVDEAPTAGYAEGYGSAEFHPDDPAAEGYSAGRFRAAHYSENSYGEGGGYPENSYPENSYPGDAYPGAGYTPEPGTYRDSEYHGEYSERAYESSSYPAGAYPGSGYSGGGFTEDGYPEDSDAATMLLAQHGTPSDESGDDEIMRCPVCAAPNYTDARYCEACGFAFAGAPVSGGDEDHREIDLGPLAGVCDRGVRHTTNEDAMGVAIVHGTLIAVVCDGVSTTPGSGEASAAAAATATAILADAVRAHGPGEAVPYKEPSKSAASEVLDVLEEYSEFDEPRTAPRRISGGFGPDEADAALHTAVEAAQATIAQLSAAEGRMAPSCTFAAAIITQPSADGPGMVTVGWVGDSRVYLLGPRWCERLTADDTWAAEAARAGLIPASEAETHRRAHTLTRWLGGDAEDVTPHTAAFPIETPATVVVCSDGLWNYSSRPDVLASLVNHLDPDAAALDVARHLVDFAIDQGGHDNITVVAARVTG